MGIVAAGAAIFVAIAIVAMWSDDEWPDHMS